MKEAKPMESIAAAREPFKRGGTQSDRNRQGSNGANTGEHKMTANADQVWLRVRARLRAAVGEDVFTSWFARLELEEIVGDLAHPSVPTRFLCSWIQSNYMEKIMEAFTAENDAVTRLHFTVRVNGQARPRLVSVSDSNCEEDGSSAAAVPTMARGSQLTPIPAAPQQGPRADALSGSSLDRRLTFDSFVAGQANEMALGVAKQVASAAANNIVTFNPVYIHSSVRLGKTHLLNAIAWAAGASDTSRNIVYLTADHFMYHFITAVKSQSALAFKEWLRRIDLLLIDDMQFLQGKSATEFGHTLSSLISGTKQVVVAGDAPPRDLEMLDDRVRSRLSGGLVIPIAPFDADLRRAIVHKRAAQAASRFTGLNF